MRLRRDNITPSFLLLWGGDVVYITPPLFDFSMVEKIEVFSPSHFVFIKEWNEGGGSSRINEERELMNYVES